jgi:hypothetical protein
MDDVLQSTPVQNFGTPVTVFTQQLQTDNAMPHCISSSADTLRNAPRRVSSKRHSHYGVVSMRKNAFRELT